MGKYIAIVAVLLLCSCSDCKNSYSEQFNYYIGKNIENTDAFLRSVKANNLDSIKYYKAQGDAYAECVNHFYKLMYPNN